MKKAKCFLTSVLLTVLVLTAVPAYSQGLIIGMAAGALLFGGDSSNVGSASASIIYTLPDVSERVKNPLEIKMASIIGIFSRPASNQYNSTGGMTLQELFAKAVENPKAYEILQIVRVFLGESPDKAAIWFCYIEKSKLLPPPEPKKE